MCCLHFKSMPALQSLKFHHVLPKYDPIVFGSDSLLHLKLKNRAIKERRLTGSVGSFPTLFRRILAHLTLHDPDYFMLVQSRKREARYLLGKFLLFGGNYSDKRIENIFFWNRLLCVLLLLGLRQCITKQAL